MYENYTFCFFFHANARQNDFVIQWWESLDVYKYQTLHDYNPIINKLMIQMANVSSTLMWDVARKDRNVQHECIYWSSVQEKKNHHWMMNTIVTSTQINYSRVSTLNFPDRRENTRLKDLEAGNFQRKISTKESNRK